MLCRIRLTCPSPHLSSLSPPQALTKKRHTERVLERLTASSEDLHAVRTEIDALRTTVQGLEAQVASAEEAKHTARREIESLGTDVSETVRRLKHAETARDALEDELGQMREKCAALLGENRLLREQLTQRERVRTPTPSPLPIYIHTLHDNTALHFRIHTRT